MTVLWLALANASLAVPDHWLAIYWVAVLVCALASTKVTVPKLWLIRIVGWIAHLWMRYALACTVVSVPVLVVVTSPAISALALAGFKAPLHVQRTSADIKTFAGTF